ncbi:butanediol dehydrogenase [Diplodia corticola]|uniref:Butanediol dehydrogenase n=1 Tax=Diplodia corticola TaxID=236234 RepID=A0A1J9RUU6_9PEZI|nr:butanediol dehydrogenase [Diplodia corticola]OJD31620.1 butanediol dehydrogenase [Diplodia corticola]
MLDLPPTHTSTHPLILGHEIAGRISTTNTTNTTTKKTTHSHPNLHLPPGTPVLVDPRLICHSCPQCRTASTEPEPEPQSQGCAAGLSFVGFSTSVQGGGFAARVRVDPRAVHVLPSRPPLASSLASSEEEEEEEEGGGLLQAGKKKKKKGVQDELLLRDAALVEPLSVAWHAVKRAGVVGVPGWVGGGDGGVVEGEKAKGVSALIVGGGPVGVAVAFVLRAWGVGTVVLSEPVAARREARGVREVVDVVVDPVGESVVDRCKEVTGGRGVDVVFECSGSPRVVGDVFGSVGWRGVVVVVALWTGEVPVPFAPLMYKECTVTSSCAFNEKDFAEVIKAFAEGQFVRNELEKWTEAHIRPDRFKGVSCMITARISLEDVVQKGFGELQKPDNTHLKILVTPKSFSAAEGDCGLSRASKV